MIKQFWHNLVTEKSFETLKIFKHDFDFVLIGGWAVYLYTKSLKSKDIDIIIDLDTLGKLKQKFDLIKDEHLKKYEIEKDDIDVDIYTPYWSQLGLPIEKIISNTTSLEGFKVPIKEVLLILKLFVYNQRKESLKGRKDSIDIISLLYFDNFNAEKFKSLLAENGLSFLTSELHEILHSHNGVEDLSINQKQYSDFKKRLLVVI
ncbi:MAG: hypothetical protein NTW73_01455 [Candidatus Parcubacteria bacterium]|nr:hypothetical protein [Candidatus Parcubacteria bacterium]